MDFIKGLEFQRMQMFVDTQVQLEKIKRTRRIYADVLDRGRFPVELVAAFPQIPSGLFGFTENCSMFASSKTPPITFEEEEWEEQELASPQHHLKLSQLSCTHKGTSKNPAKRPKMDLTEINPAWVRGLLEEDQHHASAT
ncbi:hypothetical protein KSP39_PZI009562 [Platanthera zijinensis]|uniref:Uncharacterized protein n=1 Tax=Platanthera zijinensis TaxID=2320716 RepID=A0AAP0G7V6_9ASPA